MQAAGSGPDSPSSDILATLPATTSSHPGNLGLELTWLLSFYLSDHNLACKSKDG